MPGPQQGHGGGGFCTGSTQCFPTPVPPSFQAAGTAHALHCGLMHAQGRQIRLETANAALLEGAADSWEEALGEGSLWRLVELLVPDTVPPG